MDPELTPEELEEFKRIYAGMRAQRHRDSVETAEREPSEDRAFGSNFLRGAAAGVGRAGMGTIRDVGGLLGLDSVKDWADETAHGMTQFYDPEGTSGKVGEVIGGTAFDIAQLTGGAKALTKVPGVAKVALKAPNLTFAAAHAGIAAGGAEPTHGWEAAQRTLLSDAIAFGAGKAVAGIAGKVGAKLGQTEFGQKIGKLLSRAKGTKAPSSQAEADAALEAKLNQAAVEPEVAVSSPPPSAPASAPAPAPASAKVAPVAEEGVAAGKKAKASRAAPVAAKPRASGKPKPKSAGLPTKENAAKEAAAKPAAKSQAKAKAKAPVAETPKKSSQPKKPQADRSPRGNPKSDRAKQADLESQINSLKSVLSKQYEGTPAYKKTAAAIAQAEKELKALGG